MRGSRRRSATRSGRWSRTASSSRAGRRTGRRSNSSSTLSAKISGQLRVTVLTTLQCNFACDYCIQGDHGDYNKHAAKMSLETAARTAEWAEQRLDAIGPESFVLTFFGGEPLLNLPVLFYLSERLWRELPAARRPDADQHHHQRATADARRSSTGWRRSASTRSRSRSTATATRTTGCGRCAAARGPSTGSSTTSARWPGSAGSRSAETSTRTRSRAIPALLDFLREQEFADKLAKVAFKPIIKPAAAGAAERADPADGRQRGRQAAGRRLHDVGGHGRARASATTATSSTRRCRSCATRPIKRGFPTVDGVHMGPVRDPQAPRAHDRSGWLALRLPGICG